MKVRFVHTTHLPCEELLGLLCWKMVLCVSNVQLNNAILCWLVCCMNFIWLCQSDSTYSVLFSRVKVYQKVRKSFSNKLCELLCVNTLCKVRTLGDYITTAFWRFLFQSPLCFGSDLIRRHATRAITIETPLFYFYLITYFSETWDSNSHFSHQVSVPLTFYYAKG